LFSGAVLTPSRRLWAAPTVLWTASREGWKGALHAASTFYVSAVCARHHL